MKLWPQNCNNMIDNFDRHRKYETKQANYNKAELSGRGQIRQRYSGQITDGQKSKKLLNMKLRYVEKKKQ